MGCSICLEGYEDGYQEESEKGRRPAALLCGHVFHKECCDGWLKSCRLRNDPACCPLCKQQLGTTKALPLWPSDVRDMDAYLLNRNRRTLQQVNNDRKPVPATIALDRHMSREAQGELLGKLMDFRRLITGYCMAVNNVSMSTRGGEDRIYRLFADVSKSGRETQADFESAMELLSTAANIFNETISTMEGMRQEIELKHNRTKEEFARVIEMQRSLDRHMETKERETHAMVVERNRVKRLELHLNKELQEIERAKERMERERKAYICEAKEKEADAMKARIDSAQLVARSRGVADSELKEMKAYVMEQERLRIEAEDRALDAHKKSNFMADRMKLLSAKLDISRKEVKRLKAGASSSTVHSSIVKKEEDDRISTSLSPSRLVPQVYHDDDDDDGFEEVGCYHAPPKRSRELEEDSAVIVLDDDDFGDMDYPMPGFPHHTYSNTRNSSTSRRSADIAGDDSVEYVETRSVPQRGLFPNNEGLLARATSGHLSFGPRQRRRHS